MSNEKNEAVVRSNYEVTWNQGDLANIQRTHHSQAVFHGIGGQVRNLEELAQFIASNRRAFPDIHFTIEDQFAENDKVMTRWRVTGTHTGEYLGVPASGKSATVTGISVTRYVDGKIMESWDEWDTLGMLQQIGAVPVL